MTVSIRLLSHSYQSLDSELQRWLDMEVARIHQAASSDEVDAALAGSAEAMVQTQLWSVRVRVEDMSVRPMESFEPSAGLATEAEYLLPLSGQLGLLGFTHDCSGCPETFLISDTPIDPTCGFGPQSSADADAMFRIRVHDSTTPADLSAQSLKIARTIAEAIASMLASVHTFALNSQATLEYEAALRRAALPQRRPLSSQR